MMSEFEFKTEIESLEEPEDPDAELATVTYPGRGRRGCSVAVSDPGEVAYSDETGEPVDPDASYQKALGETAFAKLENPRANRQGPGEAWCGCAGSSHSGSARAGPKIG
jgi:hypothetical protein